jgi:LacI family transcriptional regulator
VTLRDIAKEAGSSLAAVSMALRDDPRIPAVTRNRVKEAAKRLGYRPDPALSEFITARWRGGASREGVTLGFLHNSPDTVGGGGYARIHRGALARAGELGYKLDAFYTKQYAGDATLQRVLRTRNIRGLLLDMFEPPCVNLDWGAFCAVNCRLGGFLPPLHTVYQDVVAAIEALWRGAHARGYRRIGFAMLEYDKTPLDDDALRRAAISLTQNQSEAVPPLILKSSQDWWHKTPRWYRKWKPDAVIGLNVAILRALTMEGGVKVPEEAGFARLVTEDGAEIGQVAGLVDPEVSIGRAAIDQLDLCLRTHQYGLPEVRMHHLIEPRWQEGASMPLRA